MLTEQIKKIDEETNGEISQAIKDQRFKPLIKNGVWIGFLTWKDHFDEYGKRCVFIRNLYIEPQYRNKNNLLFLMRFFRNLYKQDYRFVFWHNEKRDGFRYGR